MLGIAQKILANPAKYSVEQLKQGVQNGIIPAYVGIPLIQEKLQEVKQAQAMAAGQQQQPPIAEQIMAQAAGVPALSSNLPQEYAGGGIIAFDEGGEVPRYQSAGLVGSTARVGQLGYEQLMRLYQTDPALAKEAALRAGPAGERFLATVKDVGRGVGIPALVGTGGAAATNFAAGVTGGMTPEQRRGMYSNPMLSAMGGDTGLASAIQNAPDMDKPTMGSGEQIFNALSFLPKTLIGAPGDAASPKGYGLTRLLAPSDKVPASAPAPETKQPETPPAVKREDKADTGGGIKDILGGLGFSGGRSSPGLGLKAPEPFAAPRGKSMTALTQELLGGGEGADGYLERAAARDEAAKKAIDEANATVTGKAFDDYKNVLESEAKEFGADREQAKNMALLKAGLAMMAGTSQHGLENIGKGALVGAEDYQAAAKDIKKAQRENRKELSLIEQARRAEARGDRDTAIKRLEDSRDRGDARDRYVGDALQKALGIDRAQAYDLAKTNYTTQSDIFRTDLAGKYSLAGQEIGGKYSLAAAQVRANREPTITPYQMARLRGDAEKNVDPDAVRAALAKKFKMSKAPAPGADASFDDKFKIAYDNEINGYINRVLGVPGGGGGGGGDFGAVNSLLDKYAPKR